MPVPVAALNGVLIPVMKVPGATPVPLSRSPTSRLPLRLVTVSTVSAMAPCSEPWLGERVVTSPRMVSVVVLLSVWLWLTV